MDSVFLIGFFFGVSTKGEQKNGSEGDFRRQMATGSRNKKKMI